MFSYVSIFTLAKDNIRDMMYLQLTGAVKVSQMQLEQGLSQEKPFTAA